MQSLKCDYTAVLCCFSQTAGKFIYEKCQLNLSEKLATVAYSVSVVWRLQQRCLNLATFNYWTTSSVKYIYLGCQTEVNTTVHYCICFSHSFGRVLRRKKTARAERAQNKYTSRHVVSTGVRNQRGFKGQPLFGKWLFVLKSLRLLTLHSSETISEGPERRASLHNQIPQTPIMFSQQEPRC